KTLENFGEIEGVIGIFQSWLPCRLMARLQAEMDLGKRSVSLKRKIDARSLLGAWLLGMCAVLWPHRRVQRTLCQRTNVASSCERQGQGCQGRRSNRRYGRHSGGNRRGGRYWTRSRKAPK